MADTKVSDQTRSLIEGTAVTTTATFAALTRAVYVGTSGDLVIRKEIGSTALTIPDAPVGYHPIQIQQIDLTGTTATGIVAWF